LVSEPYLTVARALDMVGRPRKIHTLLSIYYITLNYFHRYLDLASSLHS
jgi:hypothetical protein